MEIQASLLAAVQPLDTLIGVDNEISSPAGAAWQMPIPRGYVSGDGSFLITEGNGGRGGSGRASSSSDVCALRVRSSVFRNTFWSR